MMLDLAKVYIPAKLDLDRRLLVYKANLEKAEHQDEVASDGDSSDADSSHEGDKKPAAEDVMKYIVDQAHCAEDKRGDGDGDSEEGDENYDDDPSDGVSDPPDAFDPTPHRIFDNTVAGIIPNGGGKDSGAVEDTTGIAEAIDGANTEGESQNKNDVSSNSFAVDTTGVAAPTVGDTNEGEAQNPKNPGFPFNDDVSSIGSPDVNSLIHQEAPDQMDTLHNSFFNQDDEKDKPGECD